MHRFFLEGQDFKQEILVFPKNISHQIRHVLRLERGEQVGVLDGAGHTAVVEIRDLESELVVGKVIKLKEFVTVSSVRLHLQFPLSRREKVEWILQKATEVGVASFQPYTSRRTLVRDVSLKTSRRERWETIIREAAEQSRRSFLPDFHSPKDLSSIVEKIQTPGQICLAGDVGALQSLGEVLSSLSPNIGELSLIVGPEGGFEEAELISLKDAGVRLFSLGSRVLRIETAAVVIPALILYALGGFGTSE